MTKPEYAQAFACFHTTYVIEKHTAGAKGNDGRWTAGAIIATTIACSYPQPVKMNEMEFLPEGEQIKDYVRVYSAAPVEVRSGGVDSDIITIGTHRYEVTESQDRVSHYRIIMKRLR
jgi:hypothetical protein